MAFCRNGSDKLLGSPPEAGTDQTSLPSPYSTLFPLEIKRPIPTLSVASLVSCTTLSTCGTLMGHRPVPSTAARTKPPAASHEVTRLGALPFWRRDSPSDRPLPARRIG